MILILISSIFLIWMTLSIWAQLPNAKILKYNFFGFVPYCRFFSPNPVSKDLKIYYCTPSTQKKVNEIVWNEFESPENNKWSFIWSPEKKLQKSLNTLIRNLMFLSKESESIEFTVPYLTLLNIVQSEITSHQTGGMIQFMITRHKGFKSDQRECLFISKEHKIEKLHQ